MINFYWEWFFGCIDAQETIHFHSDSKIGICKCRSYDRSLRIFQPCDHIYIVCTWIYLQENQCLFIRIDLDAVGAYTWDSTQYHRSHILQGFIMQRNSRGNLRRGRFWRSVYHWFYEKSIFYSIFVAVLLEVEESNMKVHRELWCSLKWGTEFIGTILVSSKCEIKCISRIWDGGN